MRVKSEQKFWMVFSPRGKSNPKIKHGSLEIALREAERLSQRFPNRHFYIMEMVGWKMVGENSPTSAQAKRAATEAPVEAPNDPQP